MHMVFRYVDLVLDNAIFDGKVQQFDVVFVKPEGCMESLLDHGLAHGLQNLGLNLRAGPLAVCHDHQVLGELRHSLWRLGHREI